MSKKVDPVETAARIKAMCADPKTPLDVIQRLQDSVDRFMEAARVDTDDLAGSDPDGAPRTTALSTRIKLAIEEGLAERDAAERRVQVPERVATVCAALRGCAVDMSRLYQDEADTLEDVLADGFTVYSDGTVTIPLELADVTPDWVSLESSRARHEGVLATLTAEREQVQQDAITSIQERLGASPDGRGIPWVITECAVLGIDLAPMFAAGAGMPESPLKRLMVHLTADAKLAGILADRAAAPAE